jgi:hypothetical protein
MVSIGYVGPADRQAVEHVVRDRRCCAQACGHPASDVGQRYRIDFKVGFGGKVKQRLRLKPAR